MAFGIAFSMAVKMTVSHAGASSFSALWLSNQIARLMILLGIAFMLILISLSAIFSLCYISRMYLFLVAIEIYLIKISYGQENTQIPLDFMVHHFRGIIT
jgi:hypothetical protein